MRKVEPAPLRVIAVHGRPRGVVAEPELPRAVHQRVASLELLQRQAFPVGGLRGIWPSVRKREDRDGNRGNRGETQTAKFDFHAIILPNPAPAENTQSGTIGADETFDRPTICKLWADRLRYFTLTRRKNEVGAPSGTAF